VSKFITAYQHNYAIQCHSHLQGSQQQEVKFQDPIFRKFLSVYEAQDTENAH